MTTEYMAVMESETRQPKPVEPNASQSAEPKARKGYVWFGELPKYIVIGGFIFYAFGFVIWHSHLAQYGVNPPSLWKIEFFSASLCYFTVVASISFPAALVFVHLFPEQTQLFIKPDSVSLYPVLFLYAFLLSQVCTIFFGSSIYISGGVMSSILFALILIHFVLAITLRVRKSAGRFARILKHELWFAVLLLLLSVNGLLRAERSDTLFLLTTIGLVFSLAFLGGYPIGLHWKGLTPPLKFLALVCFGFVLVAHARSFGSRQFGKIPQAVGGGEPLKVLLVFSSDQRNLTSLLSIPPLIQTNIITAPTISTNSVTTTNSPVLTVANPTNVVDRLPAAQPYAFFGPVSILIKSEREIVFFASSAVSKTNLLPHAKLIRCEQVQGIEFLNRP